jgi:hypothetical protein
VAPHRTRGASRALIALVALAAILAPACELTFPTGPPPTTTPSRTGDDPSKTDPPQPGEVTGQPAVPETGVLAGAYVHPRPDDLKSTEQWLWTKRQADAGRSYDIAHTFYSFTKTFPTWRESWHASEGRTPMISWGPASTRRSPLAPTTS